MLFWKSGEMLYAVFLFCIAALPAIAFFLFLLWILQPLGTFAVAVSMLITLGMLILLAGRIEKYLSYFDRFMFSTITLSSGNFALGKIRNEGFQLDEPGFYVLKPKAWVYFVGNEEDYAHFDFLGL